MSEEELEQWKVVGYKSNPSTTDIPGNDDDQNVNNQSDLMKEPIVETEETIVQGKEKTNEKEAEDDKYKFKEWLKSSDFHPDFIYAINEIFTFVYAYSCKAYECVAPPTKSVLGESIRKVDSALVKGRSWLSKLEAKLSLD